MEADDRLGKQDEGRGVEAQATLSASEDLTFSCLWPKDPIGPISRIVYWVSTPCNRKPWTSSSDSSTRRNPVCSERHQYLTSLRAFSSKYHDDALKIDLVSAYAITTSHRLSSLRPRGIAALPAGGLLRSMFCGQYSDYGFTMLKEKYGGKRLPEACILYNARPVNGRWLPHGFSYRCADIVQPSS